MSKGWRKVFWGIWRRWRRKIGRGRGKRIWIVWGLQSLKTLGKDLLIKWMLKLRRMGRRISIYLLFLIYNSKIWVLLMNLWGDLWLLLLVYLGKRYSLRYLNKIWSWLEWRRRRGGGGRFKWGWIRRGRRKVIRIINFCINCC